MITEDDLRQLFAEAAQSAPPPGPAPDALQAAITDPASAPDPNRRDPWRRRVLVVAAAVLVGIATVGALQADDGERDASQVADAPTEACPGCSIAGSDDADLAVTAGSENPADGATAVPAPAGAGGGGPGIPTPPAIADAAAPSNADTGGLADGAKIVKTGSLELEVAEGSFERVAGEVTSRVVGLGGYVAESITHESDDAPSGSIVIRVPEASFEPLLADLRELGEVRSATSKGTDVTAQYTDLNARLSALVATRDRLNVVLGEANNVGDILMVQDRLTVVQSEIESYQGQIRLLDDQAAMATLSLTLAEPGADLTELTAPSDERDLGGAWEDARRRFGNGVEGIVAWSGVAALAGAVVVLLLLAVRHAWPRVRRLLL